MVSKALHNRANLNQHFQKHFYINSNKKLKIKQTSILNNHLLMVILN